MSLSLFDFDVTDFFNRKKEILNWDPNIDIKEYTSPEGELMYSIQVEIPGTKKDDIDIHYNNGILVISGEKHHEKREKNENIYLNERVYGKFSRSLHVPEGIKTEDIKARFEDGVLYVEFPKNQSHGKNRITIN
jgi:HSP20 family protein